MGLDLHFDEGVRVAVWVHGGQVGTADDPNQQAALLCVVAERHQDASTLGGRRRNTQRFHVSGSIKHLI